MKYYKSLTAIVLEHNAAETTLGSAIRLGEALATDLHSPRTLVLRQLYEECAFVFDVRVREELLWAECRGRKLSKAILVWACAQSGEEILRRTRLLCELLEEGGELVLRIDPETPRAEMQPLMFSVWDVVEGMAAPRGVTLRIDAAMRGDALPDCLLTDSQFPMDTIPSPPRFESMPASGVRLSPADNKQRAPSKDSEEAA